MIQKVLLWEHGTDGALTFTSDSDKPKILLKRDFEPAKLGFKEFNKSEYNQGCTQFSFCNQENKQQNKIATT